MRCINPVTIKKNLDPKLFPNGLQVPCGKCIQCRIQKRSEWSIRCLHELDNHADSVFVTLTYTDDNIPDNNSLRYQDLCLFFKRLRKNLGDRKIRYFACGEYGSDTNRPHYHAIIFGLSLRESDKLIVMKSWNKCDWTVQSIRKKSFGIAEADSIRYVAQYIDKKLSGKMAEEAYDAQGREPVFCIRSLGLGRSYCDNNRDTIETGKITYRGKPMSIPRYYLKRLGIDTTTLKEHAFYTACEEVEFHTGINIHPDVLKYERINDELLTKYLRGMSQSKKQHERNLNARINLKRSTL